MRRCIALLSTAAVATTLVGCKPSAPPAEPGGEPAAPAASQMLDAPKLFLPPMGPEINVPDGLARDVITGAVAD